MEDPAQEIKRLQRCLNDLVSVMALPAIWSGNQPSQIVEMLLDALLNMLSLEFAGARLNYPETAAPVEILRVADSWKVKDAGARVGGWLKSVGESSSPSANRLGENISIFPVPLGVHGEMGMIVVGSERADFPSQSESLLLTVAANQASIGLREAALLSKQKRIANDLDQRVGERTAELAAAIEELRKEIADRERAEEGLRASERELRLVVNTIPALAWSACPDGSAEFFNQLYLAYVGLSLEQMQGSGWTGAVHSDDVGALTGAWQTMMASGKAGEVEGRLRRFDGEYRWFLFRTNPVLDESGKILKWYGTNTDIDDRKRVEEQLRRSEAFLSEGQQLSQIGSFSWCLPGNEITWSGQLYRIFEFEPGTPMNLELIASRVHPEDRPLMYDVIEQAQAGRDFEYGHRLLMVNGSVKHVHLQAHATRDKEGRLEYIGAVQDVTQRRLAEEALAQARSELANVARVTSLGVLTASIAHEVNQPLSGIITNAGTCLRMLSADPPNVEGARETARRTIRDGNRAADVITRLRMLYSKKEPAPEAMDLNEATREVTALSLADIQRSGVILRYELADDLPSVVGDRIQLQQVILNLLRNAADAMSGIQDRPRELLIRTERDKENWVRFSVKDSGIGLTPQAAEKLFEAFYTTKSDGMGIGLSISRSIIEAHQGRLWATSNEGPGCTFWFAIPCANEGVADAGTRHLSQ